MSGYSSVTTTLTDEYGVYNQDFGSANPATTYVEA